MVYTVIFSLSLEVHSEFPYIIVGEKCVNRMLSE